MIKENQRYLNRFLAVIDAVIIILALILAWYIRFKSGFIDISENYLTFRQYLKPVIFIIPVYLLIFNAFRLYVPYRSKSIMAEFVNITEANIVGLLIFVLILFLFKQIDYSRYFLLIFSTLSVLLITLERSSVRLVLRRIRAKGYNMKHILIVGYSELTLEFLKRLEKNKNWGYDVLGILDDNEQFNTIGRISELEYFLNNFDIDEVFITLSIKEYEKLGNIIKVCEKTGVRTEIIPDYYRYIPARPCVEEIDGLPIINIRYVPLDNLIKKVIKRLFDIVLSLIGIILFSPMMVGVAIIIKLTSPGPILFEQQRVGLNKKTFNMYKFRSMKVQRVDIEKVQWTTEDDPRKTSFGCFIRKTSIDELPQLFNVLRGDMSIVGPRPERPYFVDKFKEEIPKYMVKHQVRPGITGWAQVNGWRGDTSIERRIECDIYYIENWNFWMDIKIVFLTILKGFINKNAY